MKSKIHISYFYLLLGFVSILSMGYLIGCQSTMKKLPYPQGIILNEGPGLEKMQAVTEEFLQAWNNRDASGCANTYSKTAIFMPQGQSSVKGRENIRKFFYDREWEAPEGSEMNIKEEVEEVIYFGDWAVMRGLGEITTIEPDSNKDKYGFKWVMLSQKNETGEWESVWDIFNDN